MHIRCKKALNSYIWESSNW